MEEGTKTSDPNIPAQVTDIQIDPKKKLTNADKALFIRIIERQFTEQTSGLKLMRENAKNEALKKYRDSVGFDKLQRELELAEAQCIAIKSRIAILGLNEDGGIYERYTSMGLIGEQKEKAKKKGEEVQKLIDESLKGIGQPELNKDKLITMIQFCSSAAEAQVIMQSILGNGIIKPLPKNLLTYEEE